MENSKRQLFWELALRLADLPPTERDSQLQVLRQRAQDEPTRRMIPALERWLLIVQEFDAPCRPSALSAEFKEQLRSDLNEEEIVAALQELRTGSGQELTDFIKDLEQVATHHERAGNP